MAKKQDRLARRESITDTGRQNQEGCRETNRKGEKEGKQAEKEKQ